MTPRVPLFVERQGYRRRRLRDAAKALPVLGVILWFAPLLWNVDAEAMQTSSVLIYMFGTWVFLALAGAGIELAFVRLDRRNTDPTGPKDTPEGTVGSEGAKDQSEGAPK